MLFNPRHVQLPLSADHPRGLQEPVQPPAQYGHAQTPARDVIRDQEKSWRV